MRWLYFTEATPREASQHLFWAGATLQTMAVVLTPGFKTSFSSSFFPSPDSCNYCEHLFPSSFDPEAKSEL